MDYRYSLLLSVHGAVLIHHGDVESARFSAVDKLRVVHLTLRKQG